MNNNKKLYRFLAIVLFVVFAFILVFLGILLIGPNKTNNPFIVAIFYFVNMVIILPLVLYFLGK